MFYQRNTSCLCVHCASWLRCHRLLDIKVTNQPLDEVSEIAVRTKNILTVVLSTLCHQTSKYSGKRNVAHNILNYRKKKILIPEMRCDQKELSSDLALLQGNQRNSSALHLIILSLRKSLPISSFSLTKHLNSAPGINSHHLRRTSCRRKTSTVPER